MENDDFQQDSDDRELDCPGFHAAGKNRWIVTAFQQNTNGFPEQM